MMTRAVLLVGAMLAATSAGAEVTVTITGDEEAGFELECGVTRIRSRPPATIDLPAPADCTIVQTGEGGKLTVEAKSQQGNVTRLSTSGQDSMIRFHIE